MNFVFVQPHLKYGGAERQTVIVANGLVKRGNSVTVILHSWSDNLEGELHPDVSLINLRAPGQLSILLAAWRLLLLLKRMPPSFVIVKLWTSNLTVGLVERLLPQHYFNHCEDLDPSDHAEYIAFGKVKQTLIGMLFRRRQSRLTANTYRVSSSMKDVYRLDVDPPVIFSTVESTLVREQANIGETINRVPGVLNVLTVGSLVQRKGLQEIHSALLKYEMPIAWHVVGNGPMKETILEWFESKSNVIGHLYPGCSNPYGYMSTADALVHGALSEAFGIVILESLAVGTPVIANATIGPIEIRRVLGENAAGLHLYGQGNAEALSSTLHLVSSKGDTSSMSRQFLDYIAPYETSRSVLAWERRAHEKLGVRGHG